MSGGRAKAIADFLYTFWREAALRGTFPVVQGSVGVGTTSPQTDTSNVVFANFTSFLKKPISPNTRNDATKRRLGLFKDGYYTGENPAACVSATLNSAGRSIEAR
jgi:hypothetical protein